MRGAAHSSCGGRLSRAMWVLQPPTHWPEHSGAGAVLGAAKSSVVGINSAGCVCTQCLFKGNVSFSVTYSLQGLGFVSLPVGLKGDWALLGPCLPGQGGGTAAPLGSPKPAPPQLGSRR